MTVEEFKAWFLEQLRDGPIKATEIPIRLGINCNALTMDQINAALRTLVNEKKIFEIEYTNANTPYRVKAIFFLGGSYLYINGFKYPQDRSI